MVWKVVPTTWQTNFLTESYNELRLEYDNLLKVKWAAYIESGDFLEELALVLNCLPEQNKIALLKNVGNVDDLLHGVIAHLSWQEEIFAHHEITERQVGERLEEDQVSYAKIQCLRVELVEFQYSQIGVEIVDVVLCLLLNVLLEELEVNRIVAGITTNITGYSCARN